MQKAVDLAKKISKNPENVWVDEIREINLHKVFEPILKASHYNLQTINKIICFIIFAYDNDSPWIEILQDRKMCKQRIATGLDCDINLGTFAAVVEGDNEVVNEAAIEYIISQTTWKWQHIMTSLDQYQKLMRFVNQKTEEEKIIEKQLKDGSTVSVTEEYGSSKIGELNKQKNSLLGEARKLRMDTDELIKEIKKEFVKVDYATQSDFDFEITDEKKIDIMQWKDFIRYKVKPLRDAK